MGILNGYVATEYLFFGEFEEVLQQDRHRLLIALVVDHEIVDLDCLGQETKCALVALSGGHRGGLNQTSRTERIDVVPDLSDNILQLEVGGSLLFFFGRFARLFDLERGELDERSFVFVQLCCLFFSLLGSVN
jgi:hypothetical protein